MNKRIGDIRGVNGFLPIMCACCNREVDEWRAFTAPGVPNGLRFKVRCHGEVEECVFDPTGLKPDDLLLSSIAFRTPEEMGEAHAKAHGWAAAEVERKARLAYMDDLLRAGFERFEADEQSSFRSSGFRFHKPHLSKDKMDDMMKRAFDEAQVNAFKTRQSYRKF